MIDLVGTVTSALDTVPPSAAYAVLAVVVLAESVLLVGAVVPTFTVLLTAGALASRGTLDVVVVVAVAAAAVVVGDHLAHRAGRTLASRSPTSRLVRAVPASVLTRGERALAEHGGRAVFVGRFLPVVRTLTPYLAGGAGVPYSSIMGPSIAAATVWASAEVGLGYVAAASLSQLTRVGPPAVAAVAVVAAVLVVRVSIRRPREEHVPSPHVAQATR